MIVRGNSFFGIIDQVPVSQHSDIEVDILDVSGAMYDEKSGELKWKTALAANESKNFIISFSVKYPKNKNVRIALSGRILKKRAIGEF